MSDETEEQPNSEEIIQTVPPEIETEAVIVTPAAPEAPPQYEAATGGISWLRALRQTVGIGVTFGVIGAVMGLYEFAGQVLTHILSADVSADFQETSAGLPVPNVLDWNPAKIEFLQIVSGLSMVVLACCAAGFYGGLLARSIAALNPTFHLLNLFHSKSKFGGYIFNPAAMSKAFRAALRPGLAMGLVWLFTLLLRGRAADFAWEIRLIAVGAALWTAFGLRGFSGDFARRDLQSLRPAFAELSLRGALFGLLAYVLMQTAAPAALGPLLDRYQAFGTFHRGYLNFIALHYFGSLALAWFGAGTLLLALGQPQLRLLQRAGLLAFPLAAVWLALLLQNAFQPAALAARSDLTPAVLASINSPYNPRAAGSGVPEDEAAALELAARIGMTNRVPLPDRSLALFIPQQGLLARQAGITQDGLPLDVNSLAPTRNFLEKRHYKTALSWAAIRHLFNVHAANFDTTAAMSDLLLDLTRCPHLIQCSRTLFTMFHTCAATPENLALLDQYADLRQFAHPDRDSLRHTGDLYRRFGQTEKALLWYRRADMPKTFMARIASEKPMFHTGRITGIVRFNGKPLAGADIAAEPYLLNGLPPDMEGDVRRNGLEIIGRFRSFPQFGPFHPFPFAFRQISAAAPTDAKGAFHLENLTEGSYWLICRLPGTIRLRIPIDTRLQILHAPAAVNLNYKTPAFDAGTLDFTLDAKGTDAEGTGNREQGTESKDAGAEAIQNPKSKIQNSSVSGRL